MSRIGVVVFPGSNCELDVQWALEALGAEAPLVWHRETDLSELDAVVLPGGFAHGDYLRTGAIARFSPVMSAIARMAEEGSPVVGICNGFQILCEAHLLSGALIANRDLRFICRPVPVEVTDTSTVLTMGLEVGDVLTLPLNSYEGQFTDPSGSARVVARYAEDVNGSQFRAAAVANEGGNVVGIMPHPERSSEEILGSADGRRLLESLIAVAERLPA
ncbi:MAG TPA: phosphoribosylformylglycinamidine synthase subunit PurQ [Acidimicrobiia bacterium]|nr:phosphoribosylformylglycinamidine synthase subunit PurQ [Acidimicrobiia bacterium]